MTVKLPERSILDELAEQKDRIIEEGNLYLAYIYSSLSRTPKRVYTFEELLEYFETLHLNPDSSGYKFRGVLKGGKRRVEIFKTSRENLIPFIKKVIGLFRSYKSLEYIE